RTRTVHRQHQRLRLTGAVVLGTALLLAAVGALIAAESRRPADRPAGPAGPTGPAAGRPVPQSAVR
ncbi:hypothetical protein ACFXC7_35800, partial [Streptomyces virginiae]